MAAEQIRCRKLIVEICNAKNLMPKDGQGTASAYVLVDFDGQRQRMTTKFWDLNPQWDERLEFLVHDSESMASEMLKLNLYNDKKTTRKRTIFLGRVKISGSSFVQAGSKALVYYPLEKRSVFSQIKGEIGVRVWYVDEEAALPPPEEKTEAPEEEKPPEKVEEGSPPAADGDKKEQNQEDQEKKPKNQESEKNDETLRYGLVRGICTLNSTPVCDCLHGFRYKSEKEWGLNEFFGRCLRNTNFKCGNGVSDYHEGGMDRFEMYRNMRLPRHPQNVTAGNGAECESTCLKNCSCTAYAYSNSIGYCSFWVEEVLNLRQFREDHGNGSSTLTGETKKQ